MSRTLPAQRHFGTGAEVSWCRSVRTPIPWVVLRIYTSHISAKFVFSVLICSSSVFCILALGSGQRLLYRLGSGLGLVLQFCAYRDRGVYSYEYLYFTEIGSTNTTNTTMLHKTQNVSRSLTYAINVFGNNGFGEFDAQYNLSADPTKIWSPNEKVWSLK